MDMVCFGWFVWEEDEMNPEQMKKHLSAMYTVKEEKILRMQHS